MGGVRKLFRRFLLLNKRLFKKTSFVLILCAIPVLVAAVSAVASQRGGIVTVALAAEDPDDAIARAVIDDLTSDRDSIVRFITLDDASGARDKVAYGKADGAWVFSADMAAKIRAFTEDHTTSGPCVTIIEREDTVALKLAREKLSGVMSDYFSRELMRDYSRRNVPQMSGYSDEEFEEFFSSAFNSGEIFEFSYLERGEDASDVSLDILMLPVRGLLAVTVILSGLATAMYYMQDDKKQTFCRVLGRERPFFAAMYQFTGVFDAALVVLVTIAASGISVSFWREAAAIGVFTLTTAAFCILVRRLCGRLGRLGAVAPILVVALIAVSPIFFTMAEIRPAQLLTPTYYYLMSIHRPVYMLYGLGYALVLAVADYLIYRITDRA